MPYRRDFCVACVIETNAICSRVLLSQWSLYLYFTAKSSPKAYRCFPTRLPVGEFVSWPDWHTAQTINTVARRGCFLLLLKEANRLQVRLSGKVYFVSFALLQYAMETNNRWLTRPNKFLSDSTKWSKNSLHPHAVIALVVKFSVLGASAARSTNSQERVDLFFDWCSLLKSLRRKSLNRHEERPMEWETFPLLCKCTWRTHRSNF